MALSDREFQIHGIEMEAYRAVLRAFIAQSEQLSWDKKGLISELRKELRVSDVEHREILVQIDLDDSIRMIREWHNGTSGQPELLSSTRNTPGLVPISSGIPPRKKFKTMHISGSSSPTYLTHAQQSPASFASSVAIERVFREDNPDPTQVEKARLILVMAVSRDLPLTDSFLSMLLNSATSITGAILGFPDESPDHLQQNYFSEQLSRFGLVGRTRRYFNESFNRDFSKRTGIPCLDIQDEHDMKTFKMHPPC